MWIHDYVLITQRKWWASKNRSLTENKFSTKPASKIVESGPKFALIWFLLQIQNFRLIHGKVCWGSKSERFSYILSLLMVWDANKVKKQWLGQKLKHKFQTMHP